MKYTRITQGRFLERPNRFIALVERNGKTETCHVKNTGRCRELLTPGAEVWLEQSSNTNRKTAYDLVAVFKPMHPTFEAMGNLDIWQGNCGRIINMDSQAPNKVVQEWLEQNLVPCQNTCSNDGSLVVTLPDKGMGWEAEESVQAQNGKHPFPEITLIKPEYKYGTSRIDFYIEVGRRKPRKILLEVKGVTLEENGIAKFPDAPTERGIKHMLELEKAVTEGYGAFILFLIQMKGIRHFEPNSRTHPQFGEALRRVQNSGVNILAYDCTVTPEEITLDMPVEVRL